MAHHFCHSNTIDTSSYSNRRQIFGMSKLFSRSFTCDDFLIASEMWIHCTYSDSLLDFRSNTTTGDFVVTTGTFSDGEWNGCFVMRVYWYMSRLVFYVLKMLHHIISKISLHFSLEVCHLHMLLKLWIFIEESHCLCWVLLVHRRNGNYHL